MLNKLYVSMRYQSRARGQLEYSKALLSSRYLLLPYSIDTQCLTSVFAPEVKVKVKVKQRLLLYKIVSQANIA